jgi:uncharacterized protein (UPF0335 family)
MSERCDSKTLNKIVAGMQRSAIERCRDRLDAAQKKHSDTSGEIYKKCGNEGFTSRLRRDHGL